MKLYIDADVWLNFWQDEMVGLIPAAHYTELLLEKAVDEGWVIVVSDAVKKEVYKKKVTPGDFERLVGKLKKAGLIEEVETTQEDVNLAYKISSERYLHRSDALHTALAIKSKAIIVTRNIEDFKKVSDMVDVRKPEDLI